MPLPTTIFSILEIVLRLRDSAHVFNRQVGGGLEFDASLIPASKAQLPYAFVVPIDIVGKSVNASECYQERVGIVGVVVCVDGTKHKTVADGLNPVDTVHSFSSVMEAVDNCILSWNPVGFVRDGTPTFARFHPLGASNHAAWAMLEYEIPFRHYHLAYGGHSAQESEAFPNIRASNLRTLIVKYKAEGEFPTVVGEHFFDAVPLPTPPTNEEKAAFTEGADVFDINTAVHGYVAERGDAATLASVPQTQDGPFNPQ